MLGSSLCGCGRDPERFLFEGLEDLLGLYTSDAMFLSERLDGVAAKRVGLDSKKSWRSSQKKESRALSFGASETM